MVKKNNILLILWNNHLRAANIRFSSSCLELLAKLPLHYQFKSQALRPGKPFRRQKRYWQAEDYG
jgi:hypothetical protein